MDKKKRGLLSPLVLLTVASLVIVGGFAFVAHFLLQRQANYEISENVYGVTLYEDPACTIVAASIELGTIIEGSLQGTTLTVTYYMTPDIDPGTTEVDVMVTIPGGLPGGLVEADLITEVLTDTGWTPYLWSNGNADFGWGATWDAVGFPDPLTRELRFTMDLSGEAQGSYSFDVDFSVGENGG